MFDAGEQSSKFTAIGFSIEELADVGITDTIEVWPENWPAVRLFEKVRTQWRVSMNGVVGLDYNVVYPLIDRQTDNAKDWDDLFDAIRTIERGALEQLSED